MSRWLGICLSAIVAIGVIATAAPAWAVISQTNISAISTDGNNLPIKKITIKSPQGTTIATATPNQGADDDDAGAAIIPVDLQRSGDEDQQQVVVVVEVGDPNDPSKSYTDEFTATVPIGGSADVRFAVNLANGAIIGTQTGRQTAQQVGRQAIGMRDPAWLVGGIFTPKLTLSHTRQITALPSADIGNFNGMPLDANDSGYTWEARTNFGIGLGPTMGDDVPFPGKYLRASINWLDGKTKESAAIDATGLADRNIFSVNEQENDANLGDGLLDSSREFDMFSIGGRLKLGNIYKVAGAFYVSPYVEGGYASNSTSVDTSFSQWTPTGVRNGFLHENFESDVTDFGGGLAVKADIGGGARFKVGGYVRGVNTETQYRADDCFSTDDDVACGAGNTAFNQQGFERSDSTFTYAAGANLGLGYSCGPFNFSVNGGLSFAPVPKVDYRNAATDRTELTTEHQVGYSIGVSATFDIGKAANLWGF